jgi:hypothetical protein
MVHVRSGGFELAFFDRLGLPGEWQRDDDAVRSEAALKAVLAAGVPALLLTNIRHLPYYGTKTDFPGHCIVAWSYDDETRTFGVTDTERPDVLSVDYDSLRRARYSRNHPLQHSGDQMAPRSLPEPDDIDDRIVAAIIDNAAKLAVTDDPLRGLGALDRWLAELSDWAHDEDWRWAARFTYQVIEKRGTGGGGFRKMYAEFLQEAETRVPRLRPLALSARMRRAAVAWTELAMVLRAVSDEAEADFERVRPRLVEVRAAEQDYIAAVRRLV